MSTSGADGEAVGRARGAAGPAASGERVASRPPPRENPSGPPIDEHTRTTTLLLAGGGGRAGDGSSEAMLEAVYEELRRLAQWHLANERPGQTLDATGLVHEAYLRIAGTEARGTGSDVERGRWEGKRHFFRAAAQAMRRILIDRARRRGAVKRGGGQRAVALDAAPEIGDEQEGSWLEVEEALSKLERADERAHQVFVLRHLTGLSVEETAEVLETSVTTVKRDWAYARAFLADLLSDG